MNQKKWIPRYESIEDKKIIGKSLTMSFAHFKIAELWRSFMPRLKEIGNRKNGDIISAVIYSSTHFTKFEPTNHFIRWAAVEVTDFDIIPPDMEQMIIPGGPYAVFNYQGPSTDKTVFHYIYGIWLPESGFELDDRPHFEILGARYKNEDPSSEEEIWIPVKRKTDEF